jgi:MOSC domain-containing protein YiiM
MARANADADMWVTKSRTCSSATVKHRSRLAKFADAPNLRQVHLIHAELFDELRGAGLNVSPGQMGENLTTRGVDLLGLPAGTHLHLDDEAVIEVTGLATRAANLIVSSPG